MKVIREAAALLTVLYYIIDGWRESGLLRIAARQSAARV
jgi:hypothetical protein